MEGISNDKYQITNQGQNPSAKRYDLGERTLKFGIGVLRFCKKVPRNAATVPLIDQLVRSGTSIGANYML